LCDAIAGQNDELFLIIFFASWFKNRSLKRTLVSGRFIWFLPEITAIRTFAILKMQAYMKTHEGSLRIQEERTYQG
jgi:hypothetical protein